MRSFGNILGRTNKKILSRSYQKWNQNLPCFIFVQRSKTTPCGPVRGTGKVSPSTKNNIFTFQQVPCTLLHDEFISKTNHTPIGHFRKCHNTLCPFNVCISIVSSYSWDLQWSQEKTKTMPRNKQSVHVSWYFQKWPI